jgi:putative Flp pilus-assembly TadE/G-like protein
VSAFARFWRGSEGERGQALILIAITFLAMLMAVGLAIDSGQLFVARRTAQEAADAGAYAGAVYLYQRGQELNVDPPSTTTQAEAATAATNDITRNGFTGDCTTGSPTQVCVTVGTYNSDPHYVSVTITTQVHTSLVPAQSGLTTVKVHAVAGAVALNNGYAIMALNRSNTANALYLDNSGTLKLDGGGILVNSSGSPAANNVATSSPPPNVTITNSTTGTVVAGTATGSWPLLTTGSSQQADPFAGYAKPTTKDVPVHDALPSPDASKTITIDPGVWTVALQADGGNTIAMNSGIYILEAGINAAGNADVKSNTGGVFIFNTVSDYPNHTTGTCQQVKLTGTSATDLHPMTSGAYKGLLFYQDPDCTLTFLIQGTSTMNVSGTIYVPRAQVEVAGSAKLDGSQIVADTVNVQSGTVQVNFTTGGTAQPVLPRLAQ